MLEKGNYIPWESRNRRFLDNKLEDKKQMWNSIHNIPYKRPMIPNSNNDQEEILEPLSKITAGNKSQHIADVKVMNYLLQAIPNDIYNSVYSCKNAKEMWERIKRLMFSSEVTSHVRHSRLMDEFHKFAAKEEESLESMYERFTTLVNTMDQNNVRPIPVSINTKFLNSLQPEWRKYVTMVHHNETGDTVSYDVLYDSLVQFKPHVLASKAKKAAMNHDLLALILQGDSQEDKLTTAMTLLARAITQKFFIPINNLLCTSSNTRNQAVIQDGRVDIQTKNAGNANVQCYNCNQKGHYACDCQKPRVRDAKYFIEQMLLAMLIRIQPADGDAETVPSYDAKTVNKVNASSKVHEQVSRVKCKTIIQTSDDDQIDSNIIFDDPYVENNGGTSEHDSNVSI
ncbi:UBN2 domain-containing protein [Tanacetum coccineum]